MKAIFDGYNVTSAHVVVRKYGPISGRSKGFGFVEVYSASFRSVHCTDTLRSSRTKPNRRGLWKLSKAKRLKAEFV